MRSHTEQHTLHSLHQRAQAQDGSSACDFGVGEYKSGCYLATVGFGHDLGEPKLFTCSESASECAKPAPEVSPRLKGQRGGSGAGGTRNQQHPKGHPKVQHLPLLPGGHHGRASARSGSSTAPHTQPHPGLSSSPESSWKPKLTQSALEVFLKPCLSPVMTKSPETTAPPYRKPRDSSDSPKSS